MKYLDFFFIPAIGIISLLVASVITARDPKKTENIVFSGLVLTIIGWVTFASVSDYVNPGLSLTFNRLVFSSLSLLAPLLLHFSFIFPSNKGTSRPVVTSFYLLGGAFSIISFITGGVVSNIVFKDFGSEVIPGALYSLDLAFLLVGFIFAIYNFVSSYRRSTEQEKSKLQFFFSGIISVIVINLIVYYVVRPIVGSDRYYRIGNYSSVIFVIATAYAIVARQLFDIRVFLTAGSSVVISSILFIRIFFSTSFSEGVLNSVVFVLVSIGSFFLVRSVKQEISRREEVEKLAKERSRALDELEQRNKNLATLQHISDIVLNENDTKAMTQKILDELPKQLESCVGGVLSIAKDGKLTAYAISQNDFTKKVISLIGGSLEKYSFPIKKEYNLIHEALTDKKSIDSDNLADFISPPLSKTVATTIQKLLGARHVEAFPLYAGGEPLGVMLFVFNRSKEEVHDKNYAIAKAVSDDLSLAIQRAQAFEQLKAANEYLSQLDKMKDEFISMASHELNTPLAAIEGYLSMILDEHMGKIDKQTKTYLSRAYASSKRLAELILDLLNVSRIEQGRLKMKYDQISLAELAQSVIHELQIKADSKKIYLKIQAAKDLPKIWCDPDRIREVIVNLTGNAIKFTEKGGITIKISQPDEKNLRVEVVDTGRGIAKEDQKKLFQKFSQVKREVDEHQGTGLGLYISKNFVELHKGKLWVDSEEGKGATFSFEIPLIKEPPKEVEGAMLEKSVSAVQVEKADPKSVPKIVTDSTKVQM